MSQKRTLAPRSAWQALGGDCNGATAVEFALLAVPFFGLLCVILQAALLLLSQQTLDGAVDRAMRVLRTGEFQDAANGTDPMERLRRIMCQSGAVLFPCSDLRLDVRRGNGAAVAAQTPAPYDSIKKDWAINFGTNFDCPNGGDIITLRAAVPVTRPFTFIDFSGQDMGGGRQLLTATTLF